MRDQTEAFPSEGFSTIVISDLHLTEEHKVNSSNPLWKKYKTKEFFFDDLTQEWLRHLMSSSEVPLELVLNGDIFDFDSVTAIPDAPTYRISKFEQSRTMFSEKEKSMFKISKILDEHQAWVDAMSEFVSRGNRIVFVVGNHDLELHYAEVQRFIRKKISPDKETRQLIKFCEWFYLSHGDTHIEHGNQYDPYCVCETPINPLIRVRNDLRVRIPFGNMATRYLVNVMGFFNPHSEDNYVMSFQEYLVFFYRYLLRKQPLIIWTWFQSSLIILFRSVLDRLRPPVIDPFSMEEKIEEIAKKANTTPRVVRELSVLSVAPAVSSPWKVSQVLWLDRALIFLGGLFVLFQFFFVIDQMINIRAYWLMLPIMLLAPFFIFYSRTVKNNLEGTKDAKETNLRWIGAITGVSRVVFGHTHHVKHEVIGSIEHLNPGTWSPTFEDMECTKLLTRYAFVFVGKKKGEDSRVASLLEWKDGQVLDYFSGKEADLY